jgi:hypothetical protein
LRGPGDEGLEAAGMNERWVLLKAQPVDHATARLAEIGGSLLAARRDAAATKRFFRNALRAPGHPRPTVINVDGNPVWSNNQAAR